MLPVRQAFEPDPVLLTFAVRLGHHVLVVDLTHCVAKMGEDPTMPQKGTSPTSNHIVFPQVLQVLNPHPGIKTPEKTASIGESGKLGGLSGENATCRRC